MVMLCLDKGIFLTDIIRCVKRLCKKIAKHAI